MILGDLRIEIIGKTTKLDKWLRRWFKAKGISNGASKIGLPQPDVSAWLGDKRKWSIEKMLKVSEKIDMEDSDGRK